MVWDRFGNRDKPIAASITWAHTNTASNSATLSKPTRQLLYLEYDVARGELDLTRTGGPQLVICGKADSWRCVGCVPLQFRKGPSRPMSWTVASRGDNQLDF